MTPSADVATSVKRRLSISNMLAPAATPTKRFKNLSSSKQDLILGDGQDVTIVPGLATAQDILQLFSHDDLQDLFTTLLKDPIAGPITSDLLLANKAAAHESARARARGLFEAIMKTIFETEETLEVDQQRSDGMHSGVDLLETLQQLMPDIETLIELGPAFDGPQLAWKALLKIAASAPSVGDGSETDGDEDDDDDDELHEQIDEYLLAVCKAEALSGDRTWLGQPRRDELLELRKRAKHYRTGLPNERYEHTLAFLDDFLETSA